MTDIDTKLAEIQARVDKITPGEWQQFDNGGLIPGSNWPYGERYAAAVWGPDGPGHGVLAECAKHGMPSAQDVVNAKFVANAPDDLRWCLQTIAELRAKIESHEKANVHNQGDSQRVSNPANGDSSQGASSDGYAAWLVENGKKQGEGLKYLTMKYLTMGYAGMFTWTESPYEAIHFCRRLDAEKVSAECEDAWLIVEHWFAIDAARGKEKV